MGQRSATDILFGIVASFVKQPTWTQAALARELETSTENIRKYMVQLQGHGFRFERQEDAPHVYWSVRRNWFPGVMNFTAEETLDVLRLLLRAPKSELQEKVLKIVESRVGNLGNTYAERLASAEVIRSPEAVHEESLAARLEDAAREKKAVQIRYYSASRKDESWRVVSVHVIYHDVRAQFIATCHRSGELRTFRLVNVSGVRPELAEPYREAEPGAVERYVAESVAGFHDSGPVVRCAFFVREADAAWVARNLPDPRIVQERADGGTRFTIETSGVRMIARFVVGLGGAARAETPELRAEVRALAEGALGA